MVAHISRTTFPNKMRYHIPVRMTYNELLEINQTGTIGVYGVYGVYSVYGVL